jgi:hypothetical protein
MIDFTARRFALGTGLAAALLGAFPAVATAQDAGESDNTAYGTTSAEFLLLGAGARGAALSGAYAALANDVSALYYNPAGAALMSRPGVMVSTYSYIDGTRYSWGGFALPFSGGTRTFGVQIGSFGFDEQPVYTVEQPNGTGALYSVSETFLGVTLSQNFSDRFSAGITAKGIFDQLGQAEGTAFAVDFGTNFHAQLNNHPIRFSFVLANLGSNLSYSGDALNVSVPRDPLPGEDDVPSVPQPATFRTKDFPLPTVFRVGLAYDLLAGENSRLTMLGDFNQPTNNKAGFSLGSEFAVNRLGDSPFGVALRGSYAFQPANNIELDDPSFTQLSSEENLQGLALGGGLGYDSGNFRLGLDYAYKHMGILEDTHFFSIGLGW